MCNNIMVDLETLNTNPNSCVLSIGAVRFDNSGHSDPFYINVDDPYGSISADTVLWWLKQDKEVQMRLQKDRVPIKEALEAFSDYCAPSGKDTEMWGNGSDFDNAILTSGYKRHGIQLPWRYYNNRCYRTMIAKLDPTGVCKPPANAAHHNALSDAIWQAERLITAANIVGLTL